MQCFLCSHLGTYTLKCHWNVPTLCSVTWYRCGIFSRNKKYNYELDSKDMQGISVTSYWVEWKYCHFAGCKPKHELAWLQRGWPHVIHHGKTDFCPKKLNPNCNLILSFLYRGHITSFTALLSNAFMPCINPEVKIQIELSSVQPMCGCEKDS